jgi:hypothetical protein
MKSSELKKRIKEGIISALSEETYVGVNAVNSLKKDNKFNSLDSNSKTTAIKQLQSGDTVTLEQEEDSNSNPVVKRKIDDTDKEIKMLTNKLKKAKEFEKEKISSRINKLNKIKKELEHLL